jgi:hypothetical protein
MFAAELGPLAVHETVLARRLLGQLRAGMLLIADRGFAGFDLWRAAAATGADLLWRVKNAAVLPVVQQLGDGSCLSHIYAARDKHRHADPARVRVIEYTLAGSATVYRLITTILDPAQAPAADLAGLYAQRWEFEMVFPQLAKGPVRPVGRGWQHVADLDVAAGDDHAVDEQFGQLPPLGEGGGGQAGADGLAECLDPAGDGGEFQPLLGSGLQLALLGQERGVAAVQFLPFAFQLGQSYDLGQVGIQQPLLLAV